MNGNDLMLSIKCAILEEQRKAFDNAEPFDRDKITIMATDAVIDMIITTFEPYVNFHIGEQTKCFGCNIKMIDGNGFEIYLAKEIPIYSEKLRTEGAEEEDDGNKDQIHSD